MTDRSSTLPAGPAPLLHVEGLCAPWPEPPLFEALSFAIGPGLAFVRGGDGRGKTTLLRLLAGRLAPRAGRVSAAGPVWLADAGDASDDGVVARDWLARARDTLPPWDETTETGLLDAFALREHLGKELFRLSTGTRRKLALVAAFAGGAPVVLLDAPFAGLDGPSRAVLGERLERAAASASRACVVADHEPPLAFDRLRLAAAIDLGD